MGTRDSDLLGSTTGARRESRARPWPIGTAAPATPPTG